MEEIVSLTKIYSKGPKYNKLPLSPFNSKKLADFTPKSSFFIKNNENDFGKNVREFFGVKRFEISDVYSHKNIKVFLKDKDAAMKKLNLDDSLNEVPEKKNRYLSPHVKKVKISTIKKSGSINSLLFSKESNDFKDLLYEFY